MMKQLATLVGYAKAPKTTYVLRNPVEGSRNLLALRGARSLLQTKGVALAAGIAAGFAAVPLALMAKKKLGS